MPGDAQDLQLDVPSDLDHDPIAQRHIQAGWVEVVVVVGRHHRLLLAQAGDLMVRKQHQA